MKQHNLSAMVRMWLFFMIVIAGLGCIKRHANLEVCKKDCQTFRLQGRFFNGVSNQGIAREPFTLRLESFRGSCIFCPRKLKDIYRGTTDGSGNFSFEFTVDTSLFSDYAFDIIPRKSEGYFIIPPSFIHDHLRQNQPLSIVYYKKAKLEIQLKRTMSDATQSIDAMYVWSPADTLNRDVSLTVFNGLQVTPLPEDTTLWVQTAADVLTRIYVGKYSPNGYNLVTDSIVCSLSGPNKIVLNY